MFVVIYLDKCRGHYGLEDSPAFIPTPLSETYDGTYEAIKESWSFGQEE